VIRLAVLLALSGCVQVGPKALPAHTVVADCEALPAIPQVVHISIEPGKPVTADAGGEALLRAYAGARR
jgi:hypothetical protein